MNYGDIQNCSHFVTFHGLCVQCGIKFGNLNRSNRSFRRNGARLDCVGGPQYTPSKEGRITPPLVGLYSRNPSSVFHEDYQFLKKFKRLRLVLDLDETLIHTVKLREYRPERGYSQVRTFGDSLVSNWIVQPAVRKCYRENLRKFSGRGICFEIYGTTYKLLLRPNLRQFLEEVSSHFDIYLFTHGTLEYAEKALNVANIRNYISGIYARETPFCKSTQKDLRKMFCNPHQSVVIDDKMKVWKKRDWNSILKITKYVGDLHDNELIHCSKFLCMVKQRFYQQGFNDIRKILSLYRK